MNNNEYVCLGVDSLGYYFEKYDCDYKLIHQEGPISVEPYRSLVKDYPNIIKLRGSQSLKDYLTTSKISCKL